MEVIIVLPLCEFNTVCLRVHDYIVLINNNKYIYFVMCQKRAWAQSKIIERGRQISLPRKDRFPV